MDLQTALSVFTLGQRLPAAGGEIVGIGPMSVFDDTPVLIIRRSDKSEFRTYAADHA